MVGVIWFVQVVHYPLFKTVSHSTFAAYHAQHTQRTGWVVIGPMLSELVLAFVLFSTSPAGTVRWAALAGMIILIGIWASTFLSHVPAHKQLSQGFSPKTLTYLLRWNWIRTAGWSLRLPIAAWMTYAAFGLTSA